MKNILYAGKVIPEKLELYFICLQVYYYIVLLIRDGVMSWIHGVALFRCGHGGRGSCQEVGGMGALGSRLLMPDIFPDLNLSCSRHKKRPESL